MIVDVASSTSLRCKLLDGHASCNSWVSHQVIVSYRFRIALRHFQIPIYLGLITRLVCLPHLIGREPFRAPKLPNAKSMPIDLKNLVNVVPVGMSNDQAIDSFCLVP